MNTTELLNWFGVISLFIFGITMMYQGHLILYQKRGYSRKEYENPEKREKIRLRLEEILQDKEEG